MSDKCHCGCMFTWFSGLFAAPAIAHIIRIIAGWDVIINGQMFAMKTSWMVFILCGLLSIIFALIACKMNKGSSAQAPSCC